MVRRKRVQIDELIWLIHEEVLARVGKGKQFSFSVGREKVQGWTIRLPARGRPLHPEVIKALRDIEREFQDKYTVPLNLLRLSD